MIKLKDEFINLIGKNLQMDDLQFNNKNGNYTLYRYLTKYLIGGSKIIIM